MVKKTKPEFVLGALTDFFANNEIHLHHETSSDQQDSFRQIELSTGLQADMIAKRVDSVIENVGHPNEVFIHAGSLSRLMGCSAQTARNHLEKMESAGLLKFHGDMDVDVGNVKLYRPKLDDAQSYMELIQEATDNSSPANTDGLTEVTAGDFHHVGDGRWRYDHDPDVVIDAKETEGKSNRQYLQDQLKRHGLTPSSLKNFQYRLRNGAGLT